MLSNKSSRKNTDNFEVGEKSVQVSNKISPLIKLDTKNLTPVKLPPLDDDA